MYTASFIHLLTCTLHHLYICYMYIYCIIYTSVTSTLHHLYICYMYTASFIHLLHVYCIIYTSVTCILHHLYICYIWYKYTTSFIYTCYMSGHYTVGWNINSFTYNFFKLIFCLCIHECTINMMEGKFLCSILFSRGLMKMVTAKTS